MNVVVVMTGDEEDPGEPLSAAREALVDGGEGRGRRDRIRGRPRRSEAAP